MHLSRSIELVILESFTLKFGSPYLSIRNPCMLRAPRFAFYKRPRDNRPIAYTVQVSSVDVL